MLLFCLLGQSECSWEFSPKKQMVANSPAYARLASGPQKRDVLLDRVVCHSKWTNKNLTRFIVMKVSVSASVVLA